MREILPALQTSLHNLGERTDINRIPQDDWDSKIIIQPGTTGFYDLLVQSDGIREGKPLHEKKLFKFNGQIYASDELYQ